jgi:hypothetical protein
MPSAFTLCNSASFTDGSDAYCGTNEESSVYPERENRNREMGPKISSGGICATLIENVR